ncbi:hypothetical protein M409DRAFT_60874 [Zasmidium cellare ATCC 36951]|uniref:Uncharacterized protein n=1 Tax=Zasmidium cellare ATCC 36951 TaxID=1080233 RepID=A0A6A6BX74_ZASCE|nr:uncharacterized protein M409DRAFT_60874 [Zasmidium cellare ATCC 36951]KAF2159411.1 hypothetical protein M409DRAFT_60874 [Zasmidium cellare ATCC 36951]
MERQPAYRRPSWARTEKSYKFYMRKDLAVDRSPCSDNGMENFSYDPEHLTIWQMPDHLCERLPQQLGDAVKDWEYAGAAVCTALERIKKLDQQAIYRGYPDKSKHHLSRHTSNQSPAVVGADTPPMSSPDSPTPSMSSSILPLEKLSFEGLPQRRTNIPGMESPPFTPLDSKACPTPVMPTTQKDTHAGAMPDASQLARQLSPLSIITTDSSISLPPPAFDENAWETYLSAFKAELADCKEHAWPRFRGYGYTVDRMRVELGQGQEAEHRDVMREFQEWWGEMKLKVGEYEREVREWEVPRIEVVVLERKARGLVC